jgi:hypothetical protein
LRGIKGGRAVNKILLSFIIVFGAMLSQIEHTAAQNGRSFVSSQGDDSNACTRTAPCRSFARAVIQTNASGEISVLDSAGYGAVTITKTISIIAPAGIEAGVSASPGATAITISAGANDVVTLRGLTLNGGGVAANGINFTAGAKLAVFDSSISNYTGYGILVNISNSAQTDVLVSNTSVSETAGGIVLSETGGGGIYATLDQVTLDNNTDSIELISTGAQIVTNITNTKIGWGPYIGIYSSGNTFNPTPNRLNLKNVTFTSVLYDIYLNAATQVYISQVEQAVNGFPEPGVTCIDPSTVQVHSDLTNHLTLDSNCSHTTWNLN